MTPTGGETVALTAKEAWVIHRALGPTGKSPPTEAERLVYVKAVKKLKAVAKR